MTEHQWRSAADFIEYAAELLNAAGYPTIPTTEEALP